MAIFNSSVSLPEGIAPGITGLTLLTLLVIHLIKHLRYLGITWDEPASDPLLINK